MKSTASLRTSILLSHVGHLKTSKSQNKQKRISRFKLAALACSPFSCGSSPHPVHGPRFSRVSRRFGVFPNWLIFLRTGPHGKSRTRQPWSSPPERPPSGAFFPESRHLVLPCGRTCPQTHLLSSYLCASQCGLGDSAFPEAAELSQGLGWALTP